MMLRRASFPLTARRGLLNCLSTRSAASSPGGLGDTQGGCSSPDYGRIVGTEKHYSENLGRLPATRSLVSTPYALSFRNFIHSGDEKGIGTGLNSNPMDLASRQGGFGWDSNMDHPSGARGFETSLSPNSLNSFSGQGEFPSRWNRRSFDFSSDEKGSETGRLYRPMDTVRRVLEQDGYRFARYSVEQDADFVLIKLLRNNTFVTVMDSKGNKKIGMTAGRLQKQQGGGKLSRYSAEATAEYVGRAARELGLKSFVVKVNGFMYFRKKRQAIMSFKEGYAQSRHGDNPIVYIEDTTRLPHNGCRLPKRRRI